VVPMPADVTDTAATEALVEATMDRFGRIDVLVNNAGVGTAVPAEYETIDAFRHTLDVNLVGLFALSQQVGRHMIAAGSGSIENIASVLGLVAAAPVKQAAYCASKGGVVNLTRELGAQWARKGVRVNAIAPGWFPSEMTQAEMFDDPSGMAFIERNCPMGRPGEIDELDGALLFLASDASTYVCGQTLPVDGGWTIR
jgi:NAD(P)-dependent dehydrogenase (short-subunit alcohol dehydrogenase family)